jgi:hypothetical protein
VWLLGLLFDLTMTVAQADHSSTKLGAFQLYRAFGLVGHEVAGPQCASAERPISLTSIITRDLELTNANAAPLYV